MYAILIFYLGKTEASPAPAALSFVCNRKTAKSFIMQMYLKCHIPGEDGEQQIMIRDGGSIDGLRYLCRIEALNR
jgi:hypothetical protein